MGYYWLEREIWGVGKPPAQWEAEVINEALIKLENMSKDDETEIEELGKAITAQFLAKVQPVSVKNSFTRFHKAIRIHFSPERGRLTEANSIYHPTKKVREHFACTLIDTPDEIKAENRSLQQEALDWKQHSVASIEDPQAIVQRGRELLETAIASYEDKEFAGYLDLGVALALLAGLRPAEILRDAVLEPCSEYTVKLISGQAKKRGKSCNYEMPTLIAAERVLRGYELLRKTFHAQELNDRELEPFKNKLRFYVEEQFGELVPTLSRLKGESRVNLQRLRAVYDAIAVFYFCPPQVQDLVFIKAINGHEPSAGKSEAALYYLDYQIGEKAIAAQGGHRKGILLGQPGVKILEEITSKLSRTPRVKRISFTLYLTPSEQEALAQLKKDLKIRSNEDTFKKMLSLPIPPLTPTEITPEGLGLSPEWTERLNAVKGEKDLKELVVELIQQEIKFREGMRSRHQGKDFNSLPLSELKRTRHPEAAAEKVRRAFLAIKHYNTNVATEPNQRWYINPNLIQKLVGGRFSIITPWCEAHRDEIESHNQSYELTEAHNRKSVNIEDVVVVPEIPD